jgi:hypothetical protein
LDFAMPWPSGGPAIPFRSAVRCVCHTGARYPGHLGAATPFRSLPLPHRGHDTLAIWGHDTLPSLCHLGAFYPSVVPSGGLVSFRRAIWGAFFPLPSCHLGALFPSVLILLCWSVLSACPVARSMLFAFPGTSGGPREARPATRVGPPPPRASVTWAGAVLATRMLAPPSPPPPLLKL